jgi:hypothetical protein
MRARLLHAVVMRQGQAQACQQLIHRKRLAR